MAAPPSLNLLGEICLLSSLVSWSSYFMFVLVLLSFFSAAYTLYLYSYSQHVFRVSVPHESSPSYKGKVAGLITQVWKVMILRGCTLLLCTSCYYAFFPQIRSEKRAHWWLCPSGRLCFNFNITGGKGKGKGKAVPLEAWSDPEGCRKLRFPYFMRKAQDGGKVVSLTHRPPLPPGNTPGTHFC